MPNVYEKTCCQLCDSAHFERKLHSQVVDGSRLHVTVCKKDGFVYLNPRWTTATLADYYGRKYDLDYRLTVSPDPNSSAVKTTFERLSMLGTNYSYVLDIGSGAGDHLTHIKRYINSNAETFAIEPSVSCVEELKKQKVNVISNDAMSTWDSTPQLFSLIIMRHALEHLSDPLSALLQISSRLAENGFVYIAVPNQLNPKAQVKNKWYRHVHTHYYSEHTLTAMMSKVNLTPINLGTQKHELWGVFSKLGNEKKTEFSNKYKDILNAHLRLKQTRRKEYLAGIVRPMLPNKFKQIVHKFID